MARTFKVSPDAAAGMVMSDSVARLMGNRDNYLMADNRGMTLAGPLSIVNMLSQVRTAALWTFNDNFKLSLPSTLATPTPVLRIDPPLKQMRALVKDATVMIGLIGGF